MNESFDGKDCNSLTSYGFFVSTEGYCSMVLDLQNSTRLLLGYETQKLSETMNYVHSHLEISLLEF